MVYVQILLIILVAAPVIALGVILWLQILAYARRRNQQDNLNNPSSGRKRRR